LSLEVSPITERTLWGDVAARLRTAITSGEYAPGGTLPSEFELADKYSVSRDTVRRALNRLTQEGLLTPGRGRLGRQVRKNKPLTFYAVRSESTRRVAERRNKGVDAWVADAAEQGLTAAQSISVAMDEAAPEVASRLEIPEGNLVVVRRRVRTLDGEPHNLNDTYYPRDIAEGTPIMHPADVAQGTIALMADLGYKQVRYRDDLETRMPTPDEADRLQIPPGVPVLVQYRIGYTTERPVKLTVTVWPGDRTILVYEFPA
jgi:GntR family transcriptional regulator